MQHSIVFFFLVFIGVVVCLQPSDNKFSLNTSPYNPPPHKETAKRARYVVHNVNWGVLATISTHYNRTGLPFSNIVTMSDGPVGNSSGVPYFYLMDWDMSMEDVEKNSEVSFTVSEEETSFCKMHSYNPEFPLCTRVSLCGKLIKITDPVDKAFALNALFSRFPEMKTWPSSHGFFPARINIELVWMLDYFGPSKVVPMNEYFSADPVH